MSNYHCDSCGQKKEGDPARESALHGGATFVLQCPECFFESDPNRLEALKNVITYVDGARLDLKQTEGLDVPKDLRESLDRASGSLRDCTVVASQHIETADEVRSP